MKSLHFIINKIRKLNLVNIKLEMFIYKRSLEEYEVLVVNICIIFSQGFSIKVNGWICLLCILCVHFLKIIEQKLEVPNVK